MVSAPVSARIARGSHVTLHYRLAVLLDGGEREVVSTFGDRPATLTVGGGELAEALENCLIGLPEGVHRQFELAAGQGYGVRSAELVQTLSAAAFEAHAVAAEYRPGDIVELRSPDGRAVSGVLKQRDAQQVVVDFNHPLAGLPLKFDVQVVGVL